jgi:hypothetical protein
MEFARPPGFGAALPYCQHKLFIINGLHWQRLSISMAGVFPKHLGPKYPGSLVDTAFLG